MKANFQNGDIKTPIEGHLNVQHWCFNFIELTHLCMDKSIFTIPL